MKLGGLTFQGATKMQDDEGNLTIRRLTPAMSDRWPCVQYRRDEDTCT